MLAVFTIAACLVPTHETLHDHNSFVSRSDCAFDWLCERTHPHAWAPPSLHILGLFLHLMPGQYGVAMLLALSLIQTVGAAGLFYLCIRQLFASFGSETLGKHVALWSLAFLLAHPAFLRLAVAGTLWPYTAIMFWAAALCALHAIRGGSFRVALAAAGFLGFATLSSLAVMPWGLLVFLAPLCWRQKAGEGVHRLPSWRWIVPIGVGLAFMVPYGVLTLLGLSRQGGIGRDISDSVANLLYADASITPVLWGALAVFGVVALLRHHARMSLPILYAFVISEAILGAQVDVVSGYPTRFIHGFLSFFFSALLAGTGAEMLVAISPRLRGAARGVLAVACVAVIPTASTSLSLLTESRVLGRELWAIERALPELPTHDCMVIPPEYFVTEWAKVKHGSDPVEAQFPVGAYRAAMKAAGRNPPSLLDVNHFLQEPCTGEVLFYLGSTFRTWLHGEIAADLIPADTVDREPLQRLLRKYRLEPVREFSMSTRNPELVVMRLAADRTDRVTLGFYRILPLAPPNTTPAPTTPENSNP
jgi:hypothetical protein